MMLDQYKKEALEFVRLVLDSGYRAFLAERGTYGFYTDAEGSRVVSFQIGNQMSVAGNYKAVNYIDGFYVGNGWQILDHLPSSKEEIRRCFEAKPPVWATKRLPVKLVTLEQHLKEYQASSRFTEVVS